jgi:hypothetical protein
MNVSKCARDPTAEASTKQIPHKKASITARFPFNSEVHASIRNLITGITMVNVKQ